MIKQNKKGQGVFLDLILMAVVVIGAAIIIGFFLYFSNTIYGVIVDSPITVSLPNGNQFNATQELRTVADPVINGVQQVRWWAFALFFAFFIYIVGSSFFIRASAANFIVYIIVSVIVFLISLYLTYVYENVTGAGTALSETYLSMGVFHTFMLNFHIWMLITSVCGLIALMIGASRSEEEGGSI